MQNQKKVIFLMLFLILCLLTSIRDVISELFFNSTVHAFSPETIVMIYCLCATILGLLIARIKNKLPSKQVVKDIYFWKLLIGLNLSSFLAYYFFFKAIEGPLSSGIISFIDYSTIPFFTAISASIFLKEKITKNFTS